MKSLSRSETWKVSNAMALDDCKLGALARPPLDIETLCFRLKTTIDHLVPVSRECEQPMPSMHCRTLLLRHMYRGYRMVGSAMA